MRAHKMNGGKVIPACRQAGVRVLYRPHEIYMCPVCLSSQLNPRHHGYYRCTRCGSYYAVTLPDAKIRQKETEESAKSVITSQRQELIARDYTDRLAAITKWTTKLRHMLDFGCGSGLFLKFLIKKGYDARGYDKSTTLTKYLQLRKLPMYADLSAIPARYFDVVTTFDVIEHTIDPHAFIRDVKSKLKKNGILMITTPNAQGVTARILGGRWWVFGPTAHFVLFTPESLKQLLIHEGCKVLEVTTDTITPWFFPTDAPVQRALNKIVYLATKPFHAVLFRYSLGDNMQVIAESYDVAHLKTGVNCRVLNPFG